MKTTLQHWVRLAEQVVASTRQRLPVEVRERAAALPVTFVPRPTRAMRKDGVEAGLLGLFVGEPLAHPDPEGTSLPAQILLFVENLATYADFDETVFREEVRTTYLHELGHFLGLDEDALTRRELD